jgi:Mg2+/Co2+ transporter CorB
VDTAPSIVLVIALVGLLIAIAFSSGTEVAMLSVNRYRVKTRARAGHRRARVLDDLLAKPDMWLGANLVILALASVAVSTVATLLALRMDHEYALPVMMGALSVVMIVFCELAPKIYCALHSESVALWAAYIYRALAWLTFPLMWLTNHAAYGFLRLFGVRPSGQGAHALSSDELRTVVAEASPLIPPRHRQMLLSILDLERVTVNDIMIPRQEIAAIDISADWDDIVNRLRQTPHPPAGVRRRSSTIVGILHMKRAARNWRAIRWIVSG